MVIFPLILLLAISAFAQQTSVAVLPSDGTVINNDELEALTDEIRAAALIVLPTKDFVLLKQDVVIKRLGGAENYIKECRESTCIVNLGKKAQVDYVAQAVVRKLGNEIRLKVELYNVRTEGLVAMFNDEAKNIKELLAIVKTNISTEVFSKIPGASGTSKAPSVASDTSVSPKTQGFEPDGGKYLTDSRDGRKYKIVRIGTQTWMAENLNYAGKNDDIGICFAKDPKNCKKYGALYNWDEAMKVCPLGWHLPSKDEWETLVDFAGGEIIAGKKLKTKGAWSDGECKYTTEETTGRGKVIVTEHDDCATDEFGFSALPGDLCYVLNPNCYTYGSMNGYWWSSSRSYGDGLYHFSISKYNKYYPDISVVGLHDVRGSLPIDKKSFLSVRCLQN